MKGAVNKNTNMLNDGVHTCKQYMLA